VAPHVLADARRAAEAAGVEVLPSSAEAARFSALALTPPMVPAILGGP
jgi:hypothetical protein